MVFLHFDPYRLGFIVGSYTCVTTFIFRIGICNILVKLRNIAQELQVLIGD